MSSSNNQISSTDDVMALVQRCMTYSKNGDYDRAIAGFTDVLGILPDTVVPGILCLRGRAYSNKGDNDRAIADFTDVLRGMPDDDVKATALFERGQAYNGKNDYDRAIADFTDALRIKPDDPKTLILRSAAYCLKGDREHCLADYNNVLRIDPNNADAKKMREAISQAAQRDDSKERKGMNYMDNSFTDPRDGQMYRTVKIGGVVWMAENLNYKIEDSWCYDNDDTNGKKYGRLYTWYAAKAACPQGWRLPTTKDWDDMIEAIGGVFHTNTREGRTYNMYLDIGKKLKSKSGWNNNGNGTDDYGFSGLPGGGRLADGSFIDAGTDGHWWSASDVGSVGGTGDGAFHYYINAVDDAVVPLPLYVRLGFSVRCVKGD